VPFLPPNQQRTSTEGNNKTYNKIICYCAWSARGLNQHIASDHIYVLGRGIKTQEVKSIGSQLIHIHAKNIRSNYVCECWSAKKYNHQNSLSIENLQHFKTDQYFVTSIKL